MMTVNDLLVYTNGEHEELVELIKNLDRETVESLLIRAVYALSVVYDEHEQKGLKMFDVYEIQTDVNDREVELNRLYDSIIEDDYSESFEVDIIYMEWQLIMKNAHLKIHFKGKNFVTPTVIEYGETKDSYYELSVGTFMNRLVYGVTVANDNGSMGGFETEALAREYIDTLKK